MESSTVHRHGSNMWAEVYSDPILPQSDTVIIRRTASDWTTVPSLKRSRYSQSNDVKVKSLGKFNRPNWGHRFA